jgi:DNA-directed RNA polymerase specialized sigma24 family protein
MRVQRPVREKTPRIYATCCSETRVGIPRAFTELYASTRNKMRATARTVCGSSPDIDDVLHVAHAKVWRSSAQFDPNRASPISRRCAILRNMAIDLARVKKPPQTGRDGRSACHTQPTGCD